MIISTMDIGRRIYSNITGGKAIIVLPLFFTEIRKEQIKLNIVNRHWWQWLMHEP